VVVEGYLRKGRIPGGLLRVKDSNTDADLIYHRLVMYPQCIEPSVVLESYGANPPVDGEAPEDAVELWTSKTHSCIRWQEPLDNAVDEEKAKRTIAFKVYTNEDTMLSSSSVHLEAPDEEKAEKWVQALQTTVPERPVLYEDREKGMGADTWRSWLLAPFTPRTRSEHEDGVEMDAMGSGYVTARSHVSARSASTHRSKYSSKSEQPEAELDSTTVGLMVLGGTCAVALPATAGIVAATHPALAAAAVHTVSSGVLTFTNAMGPPYYYG